MTRSVLATLAVGIWSGLVAAQDTGARLVVTREVYLMGTQASLSAAAPTRQIGFTRLEQALEILEASERELSTWISDSAMSRLNRQPLGVPWRANRALCALFASLYGWQRVTGGTFDPGIGSLSEAWDLHGVGRIPNDAELETARRLAGLEHVVFDRHHCTLTRRADVRVDVGAFGKGEALDRAAKVLGAGPWLIDLGGQVSAGGIRAGDAPWSVAIAHPRDRQRPYLTVRMRDGSLSTTAGSERDLVVDGARVGHVLDPRTGRPAGFRGSVTVWHARGLAADVLSTALYVMGPEAGLAWAEERRMSACFLIPGEDGEIRMAATAAFSRLLDVPGGASE